MKKITMDDITLSTKGKMPWDDLFDCSLYHKTQVKVETKTYKIIEEYPSHPGDGVIAG